MLDLAITSIRCISFSDKQLSETYQEENSLSYIFVTCMVLDLAVGRAFKMKASLTFSYGRSQKLRATDNISVVLIPTERVAYESSGA